SAEGAVRSGRRPERPGGAQHPAALSGRLRRRPGKPGLFLFLGLLAPDRPVRLAPLLDLEAERRLGVDAVDALRLLFGEMALQRLAQHEQAVRTAVLERELAMLATLAAGRHVGPRTRAFDVRRPEQVPAAALFGLDRRRPERHDHLAVGVAPPAPARARVLQANAASLEGLGAGHEVPGCRALRSRAAAAVAGLACFLQHRCTELGELGLLEPLGVLHE